MKTLTQTTFEQVVKNIDTEDIEVNTDGVSYFKDTDDYYITTSLIVSDNTFMVEFWIGQYEEVLNDNQIKLLYNKLLNHYNNSI